MADEERKSITSSQFLLRSGSLVFSPAVPSSSDSSPSSSPASSPSSSAPNLTSSPSTSAPNLTSSSNIYRSPLGLSTPIGLSSSLGLSSSSGIKKATPLPMLKVATICLIVFSESFNSCALFAYVGFMVMDFNLVDHPTELGYYAGFIASAFFASQFISSFFWGILADKVGRKPVLIVGLVGSMISSFFFGFSKSLWFAVLMRSISGFLNANVGIAKTYMGDISDKSNRTRAFSFIGLNWSMGNIIGPICGGFFSQPTLKYPWFSPSMFGGLFHQFPFLLPNLFACALTLVALLLTIFFVNETRPRNAYRIVRSSGDASESQPIINPSFRKLVVETEKKPSWLDLFQDKTAMLVCCLCALHSFSSVIYSEVYPLWALTSPSDGGMNFSTTDVGIVQALGGLYGVVTQLFIYPRAANWMGITRLYRLGLLLLTLILVCVPFSNNLVPSMHTHFSAPFWLTVVVLYALYSQMLTMSFTCINIMIVNSVSYEKMGTLNGFAQSLTALLRAGAPTIGANLFAWSGSGHSNWLISFRFTFLFMALIFFLSLLFSFMLPKRLNKPHTNLKASVT